MNFKGPETSLYLSEYMTPLASIDDSQIAESLVFLAKTNVALTRVCTPLMVRRLRK